MYPGSKQRFWFVELTHSGREAKRGETKQKHNYIVYYRVTSDEGGAQRRQCPSLRRAIRAKTCGGAGLGMGLHGITRQRAEL